jgi:voltage-gated potassium channel
VSQRKSTANTMLRVALGMLAMTIVVGSLAYRTFEHWSLFDSFYMVVITLSTVGYREVYPLSQTGKLVTMGVIGFGLASLTLLGASVTRLILEGELQAVVGKRRMERDISKLTGHYVVCGYGRVGRVVCQELAKAGVPFVVIDNNEAMATRIESDDHLVWRGDATEEETLRAVGISRAKGVILALPNEADNVYVTLLAKDLCPDVFVLARSISDHGDRRLKAAGADRVVSPNIIGGYRMAHSVLHPNVVEFIDIVSGHTEMEELEVQELRVPENSPLAGRSIGESDIRRRFELLVVGQVKSGGSVAFNPAPTDTIEAGSTLIVLGRRVDLDRFVASMSA